MNPRDFARMVFNGETMTCALCDRRQVSDPTRSSQWRYLELNREGWYVCPDHFPPDGSSKEAFRDAYVAVISALTGRRA